MKEITLTCVVRKESWGGYSSLCPELDVASRGDTIEEATANLKEAVQGHIQTAIQENLLDEMLEKLGVSRENFNNTTPLALHSFSTAVTMEIAV